MDSPGNLQCSPSLPLGPRPGSCSRFQRFKSTVRLRLGGTRELYRPCQAISNTTGPPTMALKCLIQTAENLAKMSGVSGLPEGPVCPDFIRPSAFQKRFVRTLYSALSQPQNRQKRSKTPKNTPKRPKYVLETIVGVLDADNLM